MPRFTIVGLVHQFSTVTNGLTSIVICHSNGGITSHAGSCLCYWFSEPGKKTGAGFHEPAPAKNTLWRNWQTR